MGALSSIPLCSRGREVEGEVDTTANRPEKLETKEETIVVQPETANHQGVDDEKKSIEAPLGDDEDLGGAGSDSDEIIEVLDGVKGIDVSKREETVSSQKQDDDGNEEVSLDDETNEVEDDIPELPDLEKPIDHHITGLSTEEETYRKTPTMLDTTSAITNMLSEIVMEADSREVVGR
eukprot:TRINITY_DN15890_c0_g1_i3.p1 TRINITY_DN15890_c0_g1~~TRINITY_DN15890_c0_g1_i3.p1  ORF type:complete len:178 (-),score=66.95 TRINITY_DN15890_c0_g1_i3:55-588(-)